MRDQTPVSLAERPFHVVAATLTSATVKLIEIAPDDGESLPEWSPGSHIRLVLPGGVTRSYSLCGSVTDRASFVIAVRVERNGRGGSKYVFDSLHAGAGVAVDEVRNNFALRPTRRYAFLAGGIGITPLLPMMEEAGRRGAEWSFAFANRNAADVPLRNRVSALAGDVRWHFDDVHGPLDLADWAARLSPDADVYCCGPSAMVTAAEKAIRAAGRLNRFYFECFSSKDIERSSDRSFQVTVEPDGETFTVGADETLLDALSRRGYDQISSCREGTCGTCEVKVVSGDVEHRDAILTEEERLANEYMYPCVSRAAGTTLSIALP
jgi:ferredoxin-NADP reductase